MQFALLKFARNKKTQKFEGMAVVCAAQVYCDGVDRIWAGRKKYIYDFCIV